MKYISALLSFLILTMSTASAEDLDNNKIYNFYQPGCPHCQQALKDIKENYPGLHMEMIDVTASPYAHNMFVKCIRKFHIGRDDIGTPLFCMGDNYVMGWTTEQQLRFDVYVKDFLPPEYYQSQERE